MTTTTFNHGDRYVVTAASPTWTDAGPTPSPFSQGDTLTPYYPGEDTSDGDGDIFMERVRDGITGHINASQVIPEGDAVKVTSPLNPTRLIAAERAVQLGATGNSIESLASWLLVQDDVPTEKGEPADAPAPAYTAVRIIDGGSDKDTRVRVERSATDRKAAFVMISDHRHSVSVHLTSAETVRVHAALTAILAGDE